MKPVIVNNVIIGKSSPKIVVSLIGKTKHKLLEEAEYVTTLDCDLVEWRVDFFEEVTNFSTVVHVAKEIRKALQDKPLLFTFRTKNEGGETDCSTQNYFALYEEIIKKQVVDLLDIELFMGDSEVETIVQLAHNYGVKIIMSNHDFHKTPSKEEIITRLCWMQEKKADICKIAVMPITAADVLIVLSATEEMRRIHATVPIVTMSMGDLGVISRLAGEVFGSALTFGTAKEASAPGQISADKLRDILNVMQQSSE